MSNPAGRFERFATEEAHDDWGPGSDPDDREGDEARVPTEVLVDATRTIIARNDSPDVPFDRSINPYRGCEHGCVYCFARPSHAYLGLSAGLDFETKIFAKHDAAELLRAELAKKGYAPSTLALGANTDPYQPIERRLGITRRVIEVLAEHHHPLSIVTKSHLVTRDLDLLAPMAERRLVKVLVSITTLDGELARRMEPRASAPARRLAAIERLSAAGVPAGVLASPMIPGLNDHELERILAAARAAGASTAGTILIRLPHELKELFLAWLGEHYPDRARRVEKLIRECRGGELYDNAFGSRMRGAGPYADMLQHRFAVAVKRLGFDDAPAALDARQLVAPALAGAGRRGRQLTLF